jgi:protease IV
MRKLLLLTCLMFALFGSGLVRPAGADDSQDSTPANDPAVAAKKATLVDALLGVLDDDKTPAAKPAGAKKTAKSAKSTAAKKIVRFTLSGNFPEEKAISLMAALSSGDEGTSLFDMIKRMDAAAKDKDVAAVWLRMDEFEPVGGNVEEFRAAIGRIRKASKPVYAEILTGADAGGYQVALACDKIFMAQGAELEIVGPAMVREHYKGLLDKLGMQFDVLRMGTCKGAYEPYTHERMSKEVRENYQSLVDDRYDALVNTIAAGRKVDAGKAKQWIDQGVFTEHSARKAGLIDAVVDAAQTETEIKTAAGAGENAKIVANYGAKKAEEINGIMDLMKLFSGGGRDKKSSGKAKIAVVYENGEIMTGKSSSGGLLSGPTIGSTTLTKLLRKVADDSSIKAVVVRIDSPGGSATASDLIWQETMRLRSKKPVISSMSSVAASGGYFTAVAGNKIYAEPGTITGSIGVIGGKMVRETLYNKLGITTEFIGRGAMSGLSLDRPFTPEERKVLIGMTEECYMDFKSKVAKCRNMTVEKVGELAEGRVYTAQQAKKNGLIDELGTLNDAIAAARKAAGLKADDEVEIVQYPEEKSIFEILSGGREDETEATLVVAARALGVPAKTLRDLGLPSFFFRPETRAMPHLYYWAPIPRMR